MNLIYSIQITQIKEFTCFYNKTQDQIISDKIKKEEYKKGSDFIEKLNN
jgi:hypothetical protein